MDIEPYMQATNLTASLEELPGGFVQQLVELRVLETLADEDRPELVVGDAEVAVAPMWKTRWLRQTSASWILSAPEHATGCPRIRPASANQPLGPLWPAIQALFST